jgi:mono/diheme cytochrome c family protein
VGRLYVMTLGVALLLAGCAQKGVRIPVTAADPGKSNFDTYCSGCHVDDAVTSGTAPTLEGSTWVTGPASRTIRIVLHGVGGPIEVVGKTHDLTMPGFAPILTDAEIASVVSYIRSRFGGVNTPISAATVGQIRAANQGRREYWTVAELLNMR